jgi:hypothetical protein
MRHVMMCIKALSVQTEDTSMHNKEIMRAVIQLFFVVSDFLITLLAILSVPVTEPYLLLQGSAVFSYIWNTLQCWNLEQAIAP